MDRDVSQSDEDNRRYLALQVQQDKQGRAILVLEITVSGMKSIHDKLADLPISIARIEERMKAGQPLENGGIARTKALLALAAALTAIAGTIGAAVSLLLSKALGGG